MTDPGALLSVEDVDKAFGANRVLMGVSLEVRYGEVHGLIGANGSGKSTLVKILAGYHAPDAGRVVLRGEQVPPNRTAAYSAAHGMHFIHQDAPLIDHLTVLENLAILGGGYRTSALWCIRWREQERVASRLLEGFQHAPDLHTPVALLNAPERTTVALAAMMHDAQQHSRLLVLDEATSSLPLGEAQKVLHVIREAADHGAGVIFISHRLDEVLQATDRVSVLRDGRIVATLESRTTSRDDLLRHMLGRLAPAVIEHDPAGRSSSATTPRLRVEHLSGSRIQDVSFDVFPGEIVGVAGVLGCGRSELGRLLGGIQKWSQGTVTVNGRTVHQLDLSSAQRLGIVLVPPDRLRQSIVPKMTVRENVVLRPRGQAWLSWTSARQEARAVSPRLQEFSVKPPNPELEIAALSGGNQQKCVLAKWLQPEPAVLILDEPTRGVDVGAKAEIYRLLRQTAARGTAILVLSTEAEEIAAVCTRAITLRDGQIVARLGQENLTEDTIVHTAYA